MKWAHTAVGAAVLCLAWSCSSLDGWLDASAVDGPIVIQDEETGAAARSFFTSIAAVETPDDYTVVFTLSAPNAALLAAMTNPNSAILSKNLLDSGWDPATEAVGSGAFKLVSSWRSM